MGGGVGGVGFVPYILYKFRIYKKLEQEKIETLSILEGTTRLSLHNLRVEMPSNFLTMTQNPKVQKKCDQLDYHKNVYM